MPWTRAGLRCEPAPAMSGHFWAEAETRLYVASPTAKKAGVGADPRHVEKTSWGDLRQLSLEARDETEPLSGYGEKP